MRSASVDFPWSMWAMIEKLRMFSAGRDTDTSLGGLVGAHLDDEAPLDVAAAIGAECLQIFLGPPQSWTKPPPRPDADALRASKLPVYVHAPYLINVCIARSRTSATDRARSSSRPATPRPRSTPPR